MIITKKDLIEWKACDEGVTWFADTFGDTAELQEFIEKCPHQSWIAWTMYSAGCDWHDDRYTTAIADALIATGDAEWLYRAGKNWADGRYTPSIANNLKYGVK